MIKGPAALNIDDGRASTVAAREAPGVHGVDTHATAGQIALLDIQRVVTGLNRGGLCALCKPLGASHFLIASEAGQELEHLGLVLVRRGLRELDLVPGAKVNWLVVGVVVDSPLDQLRELLIGERGDEGQDVELGIALGVPGARLRLADEVLDDLGPGHGPGAGCCFAQLDGDGGPGGSIIARLGRRSQRRVE
jgi:hypothetical protein